LTGVLDLDRARMLYFRALEQAQQAQAIGRLVAAGHSHQTIARATGLSAEAVRSIPRADGELMSKQTGSR
jgi:hypothetical protein